MKKIFSIIMATLALTSCVDTVILPENKTLDEDFWQKKSEVEAVVAAAYSQLRDATFQENIIVWSDFRSDELQIAADFNTRNATTDALNEVYSMQILPNNKYTRWYPLYSCINYCNLVLEKGQGVMNYDPNFTQGDWLATKAQVTALKSLCYFYLVRVFRDIPVTPHAYLNSSDDMTVEQSAPADVLQMLITDLESVVNDAPTGDAFQEERKNLSYFNRDGINALLADIYLWRASVNHEKETYLSDCQKAVEYCDKVIAAKKAAHKFGFHDTDKTPKDYYLETYDEMYRAIFTDGGHSEEVILQLDYFGNVQNAAMSQLYYGYSNQNSGWGYLKATKNYGDYSPSAKDPNVFKNPDDQRIFEFCYDANAGLAQHNIRKFVATNSAGQTPKAETRASGRADFQQNWIIYRITDVMLMKAEALIMSAPDNEDVKKEAFFLIKTVNDRAMERTPTSNHLVYKSDTDLEQLLLLERARELCFEGKRWFDLLRFNYRHMTGVDYSRKLVDIGLDNCAVNSDAFYDIALNKYPSMAAMKAKMPNEAQLYMPLYEEELKSNTKLRQNPAYKATSK